MRAQILILVSVLFRSVTPSQCDDDWMFVNLKKGLYCWKLFNFTDIYSGLSTFEHDCVQHGAEIVEIQNKAERMLFSDIANRVLDPALFCYKSHQSSIDQFKNVDYEESPEYLKNLNKNGKIQLSRGIEKGDEISLTFSMKIKEPKDGQSIKVLPLTIIIGSKSNKSHYSIHLSCTFDDSKCELTNLGRWGKGAMQFQEKSQLTTEYFGKISFQFWDKKIRVWNRDLVIPPEYSYIGMDEITITNLLVNSIEHTTTSCGDINYIFNRKTTQSRNSPIFMPRSDISSAYPRFLGLQPKLSLPENRFNFYDILGKNRFLYLIRSLKIYNKTERDIDIGFWHKGLRDSVFKIKMNSTHLEIENQSGKTTREHVYKEFTRDQMPSPEIGNHILTDVRIYTESINSTHMDVTAQVVSTTLKSMVELRAEMWNKDFHEIHLKSKNEKFYEFTTQPMDEVVISTCNYKNNRIEISDQTVPYRSHCFEKRLIACQLKASGIYEENILDEPKEESVWGQKKVNKSRVEVNVVSENDKGRKSNKQIDPLHAMTEDVDIPNAEIFEWTVIALISFSAVLFATIFILNIIRGGL